MVFWTSVLGIMVVADSLVTMHIGYESNVIVLWFMELFDWSLFDTMILRILVLLPCIYVVGRSGYARFTVIIYALIYTGGALCQLLH